MSKRNANPKDMVATKHKNKVVSCSTPEHQADSPSRDSDSLYDSDAASPVPFLCTQDGAEGLTDVVWNFYTPKSENVSKSRQNSTPVSRRSKRNLRPKLIEKQIVSKRRPVRPTQKNTELFQELIELNQDLHQLIAKKTQNGTTEKPRSGSEDDIFTDSPESSPKSALRSKHCLRKNVLSSNFSKPDPDTALESDDSINECLIKASQIVEEKILNEPSCAKKPRYDINTRSSMFQNSNVNFKMDQDSMDAILNCIKLESPLIKNVKKCDSPQLKNDSFDSLVGNLNDSLLDRLTQMPIKSDTLCMDKCKLNKSKDGSNWSIKELVQDSPSSKSIFGRHNSMPESPSPNVRAETKPSTSGMVFGRYKSMPFENEPGKSTGPSDSPIRCTPDEIKKKHLQAREKLMAKRLLPFTSSQRNTQSTLVSQPTPQPEIPPKLEQKMVEVPIKKFQPKIATSTINAQPQTHTNSCQSNSNSSVDIKTIIEKKRQEALMKLRRRNVHSKME